MPRRLPRAPPRPRTVASLKDLNALISIHGEKEGIAVILKNTLKTLADVKPLHRMLRAKINHNKWTVEGFRYLALFIPTIDDLYEAKVILNGTLPLVDPEKVPRIVLNFAADNRHTLIDNQARYLRWIGRRLQASKLISAQDAGDHLRELARELRAGKKTLSRKFADVTRAKRHVNDVYNQAVPLKAMG